MKNLYIFLIMLMLFGGCKKEMEINNASLQDENNSSVQTSYLAHIKTSLKDSLTPSDFASINFNRVFKSKDVASENYFVRLALINKAIANDFILLKTDSIGNIIRGRIVHVQKKINTKLNLKTSNIVFVSTSLDRKKIEYIRNDNKRNDNKKPDIFMAPPSAPAPEGTLPDCVVTGHTYNGSPGANWYFLDVLVGGNVFGGGIYTYGASDPEIHGGAGGGIYEDETENISYESITPSINLMQYLNCFSKLLDQGANYKITIFTDLPVNDNPNELFDFKTGACGHTFIQLYKSNGSTSIQQNIGFYPESGWKSIEANAPVNSKLADNAGHEFNASLAITVDAAHFQNALNEIQYLGNSKYDIDNFNCTDFALRVFNEAAPLLVSIPQYHIPGGMYGELSNTPQGLYNELSTLNQTGGYSRYGEITIPGVAGYSGISHGPCD